MELSIPHYEATIRPRDKEFMCSSLRLKMRQRDRLHKEYKRTSDRNIEIAYKSLRNSIVSEVRKLKYEQTRTVVL